MRAGPQLDAAVRRIVGADELRIERVERRALEYDAFLAGREIARVEGTARVGTRTVPWSFIEKRTEGPAVASAYLYDNARREIEAYRSGLLDDLAPDLEAPRLLAAAEESDDSLTLWIEDLEATARRLTSRDDILTAARHLGQLSGRWLGRVPAQDWLFDGWIERHSQPEAMRDAVALVNEAMGVPTVQARLGRGLDEVATLIADQGTFAAALRRLPVTLCHHDAVAANVFRRETADGAETLLIDWESVGPGPAGADLASLLFASPRRGDFPARLLETLIDEAAADYADGVREGGGSVDPRELRLGLHASIALRWALARDVIAILAGGGTARRGSAPRESADEALSDLLRLVPVLLDSAAEARSLIQAG